MFLLIWRGYGILAPILALVTWLVPLALVQSIVGQAAYSRISTPLSLLFGLAAAAAVWLVGTKLNGVPGRLLVDPRTGQQVVLRKRHDLFFVPMQWWAIPLALLAVAVSFAGH